LPGHEFASLGIVLSVPDIGAVISGHDVNPIATTLETRLGSGTFVEGAADHA